LDLHYTINLLELWIKTGEGEREHHRRGKTARL
jgi:hypothetical protein